MSIFTVHCLIIQLVIIGVCTRNGLILIDIVLSVRSY